MWIMGKGSAGTGVGTASNTHGLPMPLTKRKKEKTYYIDYYDIFVLGRVVLTLAVFFFFSSHSKATLHC